MSSDLARLLAQPHLVRLWPLVRAKLERMGGARGTVVLAGASVEERAAIADLLGLKTLPGENVRIGLAQLDQALLASRFGTGLESAMESFGGPLRNLPAERAAKAALRQQLWSETRAHPIFLERLELLPWLEELETSGLLHRLGGGHERELLEEALAVLAVLPAEGSRLAVLANELLGASHGLDPGQPTATLVLRALALLGGELPPANAAERRQLWERWGVVCDDLTTDVLTLALRPVGDGLLAKWLRAFAEAGEPVRITLRQLAGAEIALPAGEVVSVCENPAVVAVAADELGARSAPLVATGGFPNAAVLALLEKLVAGGAELRYHGDFDWAGLRIANALHRRVPFRPWRFGAADYRWAVETSSDAAALTGPPAEAVWDGELSTTMTEVGRAIEEEAVVGELVGDLRFNGGQ